MTPRLPRGVRLRRDTVRGRWVLLAPERIFEVDAVGAAILQLCDGRPLDDMLDDLSKTFDTPAEAIRGDVVSFLKGFAEKRVLEL